MASACSPRALRRGPMAMQWHRYVRPAPAVARRPGRSVKGPHEGRQSEGVWKTIARDSLSRRNGTHCNTTGRGPAVPRGRLALALRLAALHSGL